MIEHELISGLDQGNGFAWCESYDDPDASVILFSSDEAYAGRVSGSYDDTIQTCSNCGAMLHSDGACDGCGARLLKPDADGPTQGGE